MPTLELSAGPIDYRDSGGGPVVVLLHGVLMDSGQWREVEQRLGSDLRLVLPTLPLGAHRRPMRPDADLSLLGQARLVAELLEALDLRDVTLGFNDWAAPQLLIAERLTARVAGMILVACETAGNYPPGLPGKNLALLGALPGALRVALASFRFKPLRQTPMAFGWMAKHGVPDDLLEGWLKGPWSRKEIRRDTLKYIRSAREGRRRLQAATGHLSSFTGPVTVVWAKEDRVMPISEGRKLAAAFPSSRLELVEDSYVLVPLDQPERMAQLIRDHVAWQRSGKFEPAEARDP
jgi:pimeloyl-ACP methyl ester carboxylesterase